jgi:hypothetical protein
MRLVAASILGQRRDALAGSIAGAPCGRWLYSMLISAFGAPTPYCDWAFFVLEHVLNAIYGSHYRIACDTVVELRDAWEGRNGRPVLIVSNKPDRELSDFLVASGFPCLAFIDDPLATLAMPCEHQPFDEGIRTAVRHMTALAHVFSAKQLRSLDSRFLDVPLIAFIEEILVVVAGQADPAMIAKVAVAVAPDAPAANVEMLLRRQVGRAPSIRHALDMLSPQERAVVESLATAYGPIFACQPLTFFEWPLQLFSTYGGGLVVNLVGKGRCIVWGPYLCLPIGRWRATLECEVVDNISGNEIEADVCIALEVAANGHAYLPTLGLFRFSLEFEVADPSLTIELRLHLLKGAIEGKLGLRKVTVERIERRETEPADGTLIEARTVA